MSAQRDPVGPDHRPDVSASAEIVGVVTATSPTVTYLEDNVLTELYRPEWVGIFAENEPIEHLYTVNAPTGGVRKEWYYHEHSLDRYMVLQGLLDVGLYDDRQDSKTYKNFAVYSLGEPGSGLPNAIRIPPFVWHSLKWQSQQGMFINAKLPGYVRNMPDKFRIQPSDYPEEIVWNV
jgi:dTDP-4-dehydrorhamnose 3,5-epimerase-like enzyme